MLPKANKLIKQSFGNSNLLSCIIILSISSCNNENTTSKHQQLGYCSNFNFVTILPSVLVSIVLVGCCIFVVTLVNSSENENAKLQDCIP